MSDKFPYPLVLQSDEGEGDGATVRGPFGFHSVVLGVYIDVVDGFRTDKASVPRIPVVYLIFGGTGDEAGVVHDYLYTVQTCTRKQADDVLYEAAVAMGMPKWRAWCMWAAVRAGGASHWTKRPAQTQA